MLRSALACMLVGAVGLVGGCGGGSTSAGSSTVPSNKADAPMTVADDVLSFLPVDSDIVAGIDANALRGSALYRKFEPQIQGALGVELGKVREKCGFDPMQTVERVAVGGKMNAGGDFEGVIVVRGVSGPQTLECMTAQLGKEAKVTTERGILMAEKDANDRLAATIVASTTLVLQLGPSANAVSLEAALRAGAPLRGSAAFMAMFDRREAGASVWGMVNGNAPFMAELAQGGGARPKSVDGTLVVTDKFAAAMRVAFASPGEADQMNKLAQQVLPMLSGKVEKADVRVDGSMLRADVVATDEQLQTMMGMLGAFM